MNAFLPLGKLPPEALKKIIQQIKPTDPRVVLGPGIGFDCAVVDGGDRLLVFKSDPITFATDEIGWYAVQVNVNDLATTGAVPRWFLTTLLLPEGTTSIDLVEKIANQVGKACENYGIAVVGGHTEITYGIDRPILIGTLIGEVDKGKLINPKGAQAGDNILLTKGVPIEATAILAREFPHRLRAAGMSGEEIASAQNYLYNPGISVFRDAQIATQAGKVTAMHDPTEGGLSGALWELAESSGYTLKVDMSSVYISPIAQKVCAVFEINPLAAIASGALLLTVNSVDSAEICQRLIARGIHCVSIGTVESGVGEVLQHTMTGWQLLDRPARDEITKVFELLNM